MIGRNTKKYEFCLIFFNEQKNPWKMRILHKDTPTQGVVFDRYFKNVGFPE